MNFVHVLFERNAWHKLLTIASLVKRSYLPVGRVLRKCNEITKALPGSMIECCMSALAHMNHHYFFSTFGIM